MSVSALDFGTTKSGQPTHLYRMTNANGMEVDVTDVGASIVGIRVPDRDGKLVDVVLGFDDVHSYERDNKNALGGTVGRCANRIAGASFELNGRTYRLTANDGENALHGGRDFWYERLWDGALIGRKGSRRKGSTSDTVIFGLYSPDGDQGFPGDVDARVTYQLTDDNELAITYDAQPGVETIVNLTNHAYFNLNGHDSGDILGHTLSVKADLYTAVDEACIPISDLPVEGTPYDFRTPKVIGTDFSDDFDGYDNNYVVGTAGKRHSRLVATLVGDKTSIKLGVVTECPGIQVYTGRYLEDVPGKDGAVYQPYSGIALETQYAPDAIHHPEFIQPVFTPDHPFQMRTVYRFGLA